MLEFLVYLLSSIVLLWLLQPDNENDLSPDQINFNQKNQRIQTIKRFQDNVGKLQKFKENNPKNWIVYDARENNDSIPLQERSDHDEYNYMYDVHSNNYTTYTYFDDQSQVYRREYIIYWDDYTIIDNCGIFPLLFKDICVIRNLHSNPILNTIERPHWEGKSVKQLTHPMIVKSSKITNPYLVDQKCDQFDEQLILMKFTFWTVMFTVFFQIILIIVYHEKLKIIEDDKDKYNYIRHMWQFPFRYFYKKIKQVNHNQLPLKANTRKNSAEPLLPFHKSKPATQNCTQHNYRYRSDKIRSQIFKKFLLKCKNICVKIFKFLYDEILIGYLLSSWLLVFYVILYFYGSIIILLKGKTYFLTKLRNSEDTSFMYVKFRKFVKSVEKERKFITEQIFFSSFALEIYSELGDLVYVDTVQAMHFQQFLGQDNEGDLDQALHLLRPTIFFILILACTFMELFIFGYELIDIDDFPNFIKKFYRKILPKLNILVLSLGILSSVFVFVYFHRLIIDRKIEFYFLVILPIVLAASIKPAVKTINVNKYLILLIPLSILNYLEYIYVERRMSPNNAFDHLMIVINNVVTCMLVLDCLKSIFNFWIKSFEDFVITAKEIIIMSASCIIFLATILRAMYNFGIFIDWRVSGEILTISENDVTDPAHYHDIDQSTNDCNEQIIDKRNYFAVLMGGIYIFISMKLHFLNPEYDNITIDVDDNLKMALIDHFIICEFSYAVFLTIFILAVVYFIKFLYWAGYRIGTLTLRRHPNVKDSISKQESSSSPSSKWYNQIFTINYYDQILDSIFFLLNPRKVVQATFNFLGPALDFTDQGLCSNCCYCFSCGNILEIFFKNIIPKKFRDKPTSDITANDAITNPNPTSSNIYEVTLMLLRNRRMEQLIEQRKKNGGEKSSAKSKMRKFGMARRASVDFRKFLSAQPGSYKIN